MISFKEFLKELADTSAGKDKIKEYLRKRIQDVVNNTAIDALSAASQLRPSPGTVVGLDRDRKPIYQRQKPRHQEDRAMIGIHRALNRLAK